jgi:Protein of unknown function (DUF4238)
MANEHFVPRFFLKNFQAKPGKIWCYERGIRPSLMGVKSVASEEDYYTLKANIPGIGRGQLDRINQVMETDSAPLITRLLTGSITDLSDDEREKLSIFIACLAGRNPFSHRKLMNLDLTVRKELLKVTAEHREGFEKHARSLGIKDDPEHLEELRQNILEFEKHYKVDYEEGTEIDDYFLLQGFDLAFQTAPILRDKHWCLLESNSSRVFVASDNPVALMPDENHPSYTGVGYLNGVVMLPLSPKRCLMLGNKRAKAELIKTRRESVMIINQCVINAAYKQVYSNLLSNDIRKSFESTQEGHNLRILVS